MEWLPGRLPQEELLQNISGKLGQPPEPGRAGSTPGSCSPGNPKQVLAVLVLFF